MRFIHTSDINLSLKDEYKKSYDAFKALIETCRAEKVELLLISGDLFLGHPTINEIRDFKLALTKLLATEIVILAGDHDFLNDRSRIYELLTDKRIMLLDAATDATILVPEVNAVIYGASYNRKTQDISALSQIHTYRTKGFHIYMGHGEVPEIDKESFDYIAMGGKGGFTKVSENAYYPGKGTNGYIFGELTRDGLKIENRTFQETFEVPGKDDEAPSADLLKEYDDLRDKYDIKKAELERSNGFIKAAEKEQEGGSGYITAAKYAGLLFAAALAYAMLSSLLGGITALFAGIGLFLVGGLVITTRGREKKSALADEITNNEQIKTDMAELSEKLIEMEKNFDALNYPEA